MLTRLANPARFMRVSGAVPPFAVLAYDHEELQPWARRRAPDNPWNEPKDWRFREELGRKPDKATFIETWAFVSPVVFAYYRA